MKKTLHKPVTNAFSIDVEGFVESNIQSFHIPDKYINRPEENREIEQNTNVLLEILDEVNVKATFFFVGRLAHDIPSLVKKVAQAGHEIACHNYAHLRIFGIDKDEFKEKISAAKRRLEDVCGQRVYGFRAPDFSITKSSIWALDVLKETGFVYDSSIYPFGLHDVYGIKDSSAFIHQLPNGLIEFPMSTLELLGKRFPFGGGGYFRLYPVFLTRLLFRSLNKHGQPVMFYIHPYEVGQVAPRLSHISWVRRFRHYYNLGSGAKRVRRLLEDFDFGPAIEVLRSLGFMD